MLTNIGATSEKIFEKEAISHEIKLMPTTDSKRIMRRVKNRKGAANGVARK